MSNSKQAFDDIRTACRALEEARNGLNAALLDHASEEGKRVCRAAESASACGSGGSSVAKWWGPAVKVHRADVAGRELDAIKELLWEGMPFTGDRRYLMPTELATKRLQRQAEFPADARLDVRDMVQSATAFEGTVDFKCGKPLAGTRQQEASRRHV